MWDPSETIAAISSPAGPAARGLVRITGPQTWEVLNSAWLDEPNHEDSAGRMPIPQRRIVRHGRLRVAGTRHALPARVLCWVPPRSFTGQPLAEIQLWGAEPYLQLVLAHCLTHGARLAQPGEFTLRAFLSGRLDLTKAEAVLGVIDAETPAELESALHQLAGGIAAPILALRERILDLLALVEANLDFAEEPDVDLLAQNALFTEIQHCQAALDALALQLTDRSRPEGHPRVVLSGPPNAGKSRLFNVLIGADRALVSPHAGTTRDVVEGLCVCSSFRILLSDTAGRETPDDDDGIGRQAQSFGADAAARADLVLDCMSADVPPSDTTTLTQAPRVLRVWTKSDLAPPPGDWSGAVVSAHAHHGIEDLRRTIADALRGEQRQRLGLAATGARCRESLTLAARCLEDAASIVKNNGDQELAALDLRLALEELGKVVGTVVNEDILDRIFRKFCIGK